MGLIGLITYFSFMFPDKSTQAAENFVLSIFLYGFVWIKQIVPLIPLQIYFDRRKVKLTWWQAGLALAGTSALTLLYYQIRGFN